uniref:Zinc finger CW-type PWWP domain protein 1 n=1 Tax=Paramormyrops kingsleyae TaxID=1676925 RepID=A0A3B3QH72_9TELE
KKEKLPRERKEATVQKPEAKKEYKDRLEEHTEDQCEHDDRWVQCSISRCKKWRKLDKHVDLSVLPPKWTCVQKPDCYNCNCPEETWSGSQDDVVHSSLVPGSLVWAQLQGYPWWPAMTESDPDSKSIFFFNNIDRFPSKYHVTFFGDPVTRAWVPSCKVKSFETFSETTALKVSYLTHHGSITIFRDQTVPEIPVGGGRGEKESQKLVSLDGEKTLRKEVTEKKGAGWEMKEKKGGITAKKLCSQRVKLEESAEDLVQEDMEILSYQDIFKQAEKDEKYSFTFFEEE